MRLHTNLSYSDGVGHFLYNLFEEDVPEPGKVPILLDSENGIRLYLLPTGEFEIIALYSKEPTKFDGPFMADDFGAYWVCSDAVWDMDRAHDLIDHFATAFLLDVLKGDQDAHATLLAENVSFPGITYETTVK